MAGAVAVAAAEALGEGVPFLQIPQALALRRFPFRLRLLFGVRDPKKWGIRKVSEGPGSKGGP